MTDDGLRIGVFVCECGSNIAGSVDCDELTAYSAQLPDVVCAVKNKYTCSEPGQEEVKRHIREYDLNRVVVASCTPRMHEPTFRQCVAEAGLNPYLFEMANIREHCSWAHLNNFPVATAKAKDIVKSAVARAQHLVPQVEAEIAVTNEVLVIGGGVAGIQSALDLADAGYQVHLIEKEASV
ncbi:MAG: FAD-dependent oxidoreductase, partial [Candidatus Neomarinimicrobiota bacterium]